MCVLIWLYRDQWVFLDYLPSTGALNGSTVYYNLLAGGRFELAMQLTSMGLDSLNSNSETLMTAICGARLIYGRGRVSPVFTSCGPLIYRIGYIYSIVLTCTNAWMGFSG